MSYTIMRDKVFRRLKIEKLIERITRWLE